MRTAFHKMEGFVGDCTVERCYQPMVVFLYPEVEITDLTVVHTCTRGPSRIETYAYPRRHLRARNYRRCLEALRLSIIE